MVISSAATSSTTQIRPLSIANREGQLPQLVYCAQKLKELLVDLNQSLSLASTELSSNAPVRVELFREMSYVLDEVRQALDTLGENAQRRQTQRELTCVEGVRFVFASMESYTCYHIYHATLATVQLKLRRRWNPTVSLREYFVSAFEALGV